LVHLLRWEPTNKAGLISAKFLGERFVRLPHVRAGLAYELWADPGGITLALTASTTLAELAPLELVVDQFLTFSSSIASDAWATFQSDLQHQIQSDVGDLGKGLFLEAWLRHVGLTPPIHAATGFLAPKTQTSMVCLPSASLHSIIWQTDREPLLAAVRFPSAGSPDISLSLIIAPPETKPDPEPGNPLSRSPFGDAWRSFEKTPDHHLLFTTACPLEDAGPLLGGVALLTQPSAEFSSASFPLPQTQASPLATVNEPRIKPLALIGVGDHPPTASSTG
jgi:hypothetical protein